MIMTRLHECAQFLAADHTMLRELLHPARGPVKIGYSLAHGRLARGACSKRHRLASSEVYYFLTGCGLFRSGDQTSVVEAGTVVYVPPGSEQWLENTGDVEVEFLCLVDPAWRPEDEDVFE
ncbi:MAG: cupin domain-containing protein [Nitrospiraceae bacterium]